jgi:hypothetical protein
VTSAGRTRETLTDRLHAGVASKTITARHTPKGARDLTGCVARRLNTDEDYRIIGSRQARELVVEERRGERRALLAAHHRRRGWEPSQGSHHKDEELSLEPWKIDHP